MKKEYVIVAYAIIFGLFVWVLDSFIDSLFFYEDTFLNLALFDMPKPELFFRSQVLISFAIFGIIISYFFSKQKKAAKSLSRMNSELEERVEKRTAKLSEANKLLNDEIKDRIRTENELKHNQNMLQVVFEGVSDPLVLMGSDMRVMMFNRAAAEYYGMSKEQISPESKCHQMFRDSAVPCQGCEIPAAIASGKSAQFERKGFMDQERLETVYLYPTKNKTSDDWAVVLRIKDITEERLFEKQIIQNEKMAALGMMTSSIAHEIKNPIGFISFNIPILREYIAELTPILDEYAAEHPELEICNMSHADFHEDIFNLLDNLEHGSTRIESFVSNLKEFSRVSYQVEERWVELNPIIENVIQMDQERLLQNVKLIEKEVPENLQKIWSDPLAIEQILLNLLNNAVQASDKENSSVVLRVEVRNNWLNHLILEVSDNGTGMDEKTMEKIFDPFFTTKTWAKGTGLGLYICHGLVNSLRGRIDVKSEPGEGSTFRVILPDKDRRDKKRIG